MNIGPTNTATLDFDVDIRLREWFWRKRSPLQVSLRGLGIVSNPAIESFGGAHCGVVECAGGRCAD